MNEFVCGKTAAEKGTLFQIRNMFKYRNVKRKTSDCINSCVDLWNFVTEGYICLVACKLCHIKSVEECPEDLLTSNLDHYVQSLSSQIMNTIWPMIQTTGDLNRTAPYCQDADSTFVYAEEDEMHHDGDDNGDDDDDETDQAAGNCMDKVVIHDHT